MEMLLNIIKMNPDQKLGVYQFFTVEEEKLSVLHH